MRGSATYSAGLSPSAGSFADWAIKDVHAESGLHGLLRRTPHYMIAEQALFDTALYYLARAYWHQRLTQDNLRDTKISLLLTFDMRVVMIVHGNRLLCVTAHQRHGSVILDAREASTRRTLFRIGPILE
jgi:hypothetical protein